VIAAIGLVLGVIAGLVLQPTVPLWMQPYLPIAVVAALDAVSARHGATPGQVALAWQMRQPAITAPIASATSLAQLAELVAAARVPLTAQDMNDLDTASA